PLFRRDPLPAPHIATLSEPPFSGPRELVSAPSPNKLRVGCCRYPPDPSNVCRELQAASGKMVDGTASGRLTCSDAKIFARHAKLTTSTFLDRCTPWDIPCRQTFCRCTLTATSSRLRRRGRSGR